MAEGLLLRPATEEDAAEIDRMFAEPSGLGVYEWSGYGDPSEWRRRWRENGLITKDKNVLMIDLDGAALGFVSWGTVHTGRVGYCVEFGISLWPEARGKGHGTTAQRLLAAYLFAHSPINRIQAITELDNLAEQRALEKAGFVREAVLAGYAWRDGAWRDGVLYRMLRSELRQDE